MSSETQYSTANTRMPMLDGLRGLAILCVLCEHFGGMPAKFFDFGYYGVDLFFVLSGFLITSILLRPGTSSKQVDLYHFFGRRSLRIFPPYFLLLAVLYTFNYSETRTHILPLATYTWNYFCRDGGPFYLWSLSLEEQFYIVWPFLVLFLRDRRKSLLMATVFLMSLSFWQILYSPVALLAPFNYTGLPNRMGSLCAGALGAIITRMGWTPRKWQHNALLEIAALCGIGLSMMSLRPTFFVGYSRFALPLQTFCSLILVLKCSCGSVAWTPLRRVLLSQKLIGLGLISYGIYLIHMPLGDWFRSDVFGPVWHSLPFEWLGPLAAFRWHSWIVSFPCCTGLSILAAAFSWKFIESPILRYKDRWFSLR
jgi:peptidoglycan/LPS O-acetylase OafA/YrhL